ncbi:MAG TPA: hypothetical protein VFQ39_00395, partial [Longimicrobium sp.]|nr:hypothetical protein [Longimicrobium sp.]
MTSRSPLLGGFAARTEAVLPAQTERVSPAASPRRPARTPRVAFRYLKLLGHRWTLLAFALAMLMVGGDRGPRLSDTGLGSHWFPDPYRSFSMFLGLLFFLPLLHWRGGAGGGALDRTMPLAGFRHGVIRASAGTAWAMAMLGLALVRYTSSIPPEVYRSALPWPYPRWFPWAILLTGLVFYLAGTAIVLAADRPGRVMLTFFFLWTLMGPLAGPGWAALMLPFVQANPLAGIGQGTWAGWMALWTALAVAAVLAAAGQDRWRPLVDRVTSRRRERRLKLPAVASARVPGARRRPVGLFAVFRREWV